VSAGSTARDTQCRGSMMKVICPAAVAALLCTQQGGREHVTHGERGLGNVQLASGVDTQCPLALIYAHRAFKFQIA